MILLGEVLGVCPGKYDSEITLPRIVLSLFIISSHEAPKVWLVFLTTNKPH